MNMGLVKKIILSIIGIVVFIAFLYIFFYVALFLLFVGIIAYIYYKVFGQRKKPKTNSHKQAKSINNVVMDAEYKEKK